MTFVLPTPTGWVTASWWDHINRNPPSSEPGTDYGSSFGSPVYAVDNGTVTFVKHSNSGATGRVVEYNTDSAGDTRTLHMQECWVSDGQRVSQGQQIGLSGASGFGDDWYYGPHAHQTSWAGSAWSGPTIDFETLLGTQKGFLMALTDQQQADIYGWLRGSNPDVDTLQVIAADTHDTQIRVRGSKPDIDMLQDILSQVDASAATASALARPAWVVVGILAIGVIVQIIGAFT